MVQNLRVLPRWHSWLLTFGKSMYERQTDIRRRCSSLFFKCRLHGHETRIATLERTLGNSAGNQLATPGMSLPQASLAQLVLPSSPFRGRDD